MIHSTQMSPAFKQGNREADAEEVLHENDEVMRGMGAGEEYEYAQRNQQQKKSWV